MAQLDVKLNCEENRKISLRPKGRQSLLREDQKTMNQKRQNR